MSTWDISGDKDTKWVVQIIEQMVKEYDIDQKRVYLSGFSMGGMFTYHAMSKIADKIAAFAPTSGTNVMGASKAMRPVPIIHPHGTSDDVLNYSQVEGFIKNYRDPFHCPRPKFKIIIPIVKTGRRCILGALAMKAFILNTLSLKAVAIALPRPMFLTSGIS